MKFVLIFSYLLELTLKTQVSNTMNTVGISSNALLLCLEIQLITTLNRTFLLMLHCYQHSFFSDDYHLIFVSE